MNKILTLILLVITGLLNAQNKPISGIVIDDEGKPITFATISFRNSAVGTVTDFDGNFTVIPPASAELFMVSFIGFDTRSMKIKDKDSFSVILHSNSETLDEVVVIGYGTVKKSDLTGSVSSVKGEDIAKTGAIALDQALAGRAAGVSVTQNSGQPGAGANITIRGVSSLTGSQPLYVIDGIPMDNESESGLNSEGEASGNLNPLSLINPTDISSIEILKDASATAIYGSRGANGVVLVTTKSGVVGKGAVTVSFETMINTLPDFIDVMDANEFVISRSEASVNGGNNPMRETYLDSARVGSIPSQNWQEVIYRQAISQNFNLGFRGGNKDIRYRISANVLDSEGTVIGTGFSRIQGMINLNANLSEKLSVGTRMNYASIDSNTKSTSTSLFTNNGTNSVIRRSIVTNPTNMYIDPLDDLEGAIAQVTPLDFLENNNYNTTMKQFLASLFIKYNFTKDLSIKSTFTHQNRAQNQTFYQNNLALVNVEINNQRGGWARTSNSESLNTTNTNQLTFRKRFGKHNLNIDLGQSLEWRSSESLRTSNSGFVNDYLTYYAPHTARFNDPDQITYKESTLASFFGRVNYSFNKKILATLTGRYDGSSKFSQNNKWAFFPAASIAYKLSEEEFIKDIDAISLAKVRVSYGIVGNQGIREYQTLQILTGSQYVFGTGGDGKATSPIFSTTQLANPDLKWETTAQFDIGLDLSFLKNRITLTTDYYNKETTDLIIQGNPIAAQSGFSGYTQNFGAINSKGFELSISATVISNNKFSWSFTGNVSTNKATVTDLPSDYAQAGITFGQVSSGTQRLIIGEEVGTFWGWKTAGIAQFDDFEEFQNKSNQEQIDLYNQDRRATFTLVDGYKGGYPENKAVHGPGEQLYEDLTGDNEMSESDKQIIGGAQPDVILGITNTFKIGDFDLSFFMDGRFGGEIANITNWSVYNFGSNQQLARVFNQAWRTDNQSLKHPKVTSDRANVVAFSNRYVESGSFIRLQNVSVGYNIPSNVSKNLNISGLKIYGTATNVFTINDYSGYNPDVNLGGNNNLTLGHDNAVYPLTRMFIVGVQLKF